MVGIKMREYLKKKLPLITLFLCIITIILFCLYYVAQKRTLLQALNRLYTIENRVIENIQHFFDDAMHDVQFFLTQNNAQLLILLNQIKQDSNDNNNQQKLSDFITTSRLSAYSNILFIAPDGEVLFSFDKQIPTRRTTTQLNKDILTSLIGQVQVLMQPVLSDLEYLNEKNNSVIYIGFPCVYAKKYIGCFIVALNISHIASFFTQYFSQLGKTGDIIIGKIINNKIMLLFNTRTNPDAAFKQYFSFTDTVPIVYAVLGKQGSSILKNKKTNTQLVNVRNNIILTEWAVAVQQDLKEISFKTTILYYIAFISLILFLITGILSSIINKHKIVAYIDHNKSILIVLCLLSIFTAVVIASGIVIRMYKNTQEKAYQTALRNTSQNTFNIALLLLEKINMISEIGHTLASEITTQQVTAEKLQSNLFEKYFVKEGTALPLQRPLQRPLQSILLAYTDPASAYYIVNQPKREIHTFKHPESYTKAPWFIKTITQKEAQWLAPVIEKEISSEPIIIYTEPIYNIQKNNSLAGVVAITYPYSIITDIIHSLTLKMSTPFIFARDGTVTYAPPPYTPTTSFKKIADTIGSEFYALEAKIHHGYSGNIHFKNKNNKHWWAFSHFITRAQWLVTILYPDHYFYTVTQGMYVYLLLLSVLCVILVVLYYLLRKYIRTE